MDQAEDEEDASDFEQGEENCEDEDIDEEDDKGVDPGKVGAYSKRKRSGNNNDDSDEEHANLRTSSSISLHLLLFALLLISWPPKARTQEVEDEREFSYLKESSNGPQHWGEIHEEWEACNKGDMQSPIDLVHERVRVVPTLGRLKRSYKPSNATIKNRGHDIMLEWEGDAGSLWINGSEFLLKQCHWHSPSEHSVNGKRFALEAHMVHQGTDGKIAVVGIMFKIGRPDSFLKELEDRINEIGVTRKDGIEVGEVDPRHVKIGSRKYHRYMGSLTTPPCTEGVTWTIVNKVRTASRAQLKLLRDAVHDDAKKNARPKQKINEREIKFYTPKFHGIYPH